MTTPTPVSEERLAEIRAEFGKHAVEIISVLRGRVGAAKIDRQAADFIDHLLARLETAERERDEARAEARDCHKVKEKIYVIGIGHAERATAAEAREAALQKEVERVRSDREYIIGWNDGFEHAVSQELRFPTMLRKMWSGGEVQKWINDQMAAARAALASSPTP